MEFLMRGALDYGEPGVFMTFEETPEDLAKNFISLAFDLPDMIARGLIATDHVYIERSEIEETGQYDWKDCSSAWGMPLIPSGQSGLS
jgi:circadian clock protein KaiC